MATNIQTSTGVNVEPLFKPALNRHILEVAKPSLVHQQFGQKVIVPKGKGKSICWDKMCQLPKATVPLTEGVTPNGSPLHITRIEAIPAQYGDFVATTDEFDFYSYDPSPKLLNLNEALATSAAHTFDFLAAKALSAGTNVQYAGGRASRSALTTADKLTVEEVRKAVNTLKRNNVQTINGKYIAIVHPDIAHDLMSDNDWKYPHQYVDTKQIYEGEIGELYGVKFVETTEATVFQGNDLVANAYPTLTLFKLDDTNAKKVYILETLTTSQATALASRKVYINGVKYTISSASAGQNGSAYILLGADCTNVQEGITIYPGEGGVNGMPVYGTLVIGANAYGVTSLEGNMETFVKPLGSAGSADPLNQRATVGWKGHFLCKILQNLNMVRIESIATRFIADYDPPTPPGNEAQNIAAPTKSSKKAA